MQGKRYEEAFGILDKRYRMGRELRDAQFLLNRCVCAMATDRFEEFWKLLNELKQFVKQHVYLPFEDALEYGEQLEKDKKYFESIIFYRIFVDLFTDDISPRRMAHVVERCMSGMRAAVYSMTAANSEVKSLVEKRIIPMMENLADKVLDCDELDIRPKSIKTGDVLHYIEVCDPNLSRRIETLTKGIALMTDGLGTVAKNYRIYGILYNNLGGAYMASAKFKESAFNFEESLKCFKVAKYFDSPERKEKYLRDGEKAAMRARKQMQRNE